MKRVSFKVAKAIKEAGYPQDYPNEKLYNDDGKLLNVVTVHFVDDKEKFCVAPSYLEVWLWLWREKKTWIEVLNFSEDFFVNINQKPQSGVVFDDPEVAIIAAIEYLVDNKLLN